MRTEQQIRIFCDPDKVQAEILSLNNIGWLAQRVEKTHIGYRVTAVYHGRSYDRSWHQVELINHIRSRHFKSWTHGTKWR